MDGWVAVSIDMDTPDGLRRALVDILQVTPLTREISFPCPSLTRVDRLTTHAWIDSRTRGLQAGETVTRALKRLRPTPGKRPGAKKDQVRP